MTCDELSTWASEKAGLPFKASPIPQGVEGILQFARELYNMPFDTLATVLPGRQFIQKLQIVHTMINTGSSAQREHAARAANSSMGELVAALLEDVIVTSEGGSTHERFNPADGSRRILANEASTTLVKQKLLLALMLFWAAQKVTQNRQVLTDCAFRARHVCWV